MEIELIRETSANDPTVGHTLMPRWTGASIEE